MKNNDKDLQCPFFKKKYFGALTYCIQKSKCAHILKKKDIITILDSSSGKTTRYFKFIKSFINCFDFFEFKS